MKERFTFRQFPQRAPKKVRAPGLRAFNVVTQWHAIHSERQYWLLFKNVIVDNGNNRDCRVMFFGYNKKVRNREVFIFLVPREKTRIDLQKNRGLDGERMNSLRISRKWMKDNIGSMQLDPREWLREHADVKGEIDW